MISPIGIKVLPTLRSEPKKGASKTIKKRADIKTILPSFSEILSN